MSQACMFNLQPTSVCLIWNNSDRCTARREREVPAVYRRLFSSNELDILKVVISEPTRTKKCCAAFPSHTLSFTDYWTDFSFSVQSRTEREN